MLNVYISNIILNKKDKTKTIQLKSINKEKVKKNTCSHCGQQLPWFCVCYLNKDKKILN